MVGSPANEPAECAVIDVMRSNAEPEPFAKCGTCPVKHHVRISSNRNGTCIAYGSQVFHT